MELRLTLAALLDAAGGFLFLLEGLAILFLARASQRGRLIGGLATLFGLMMVLQNLILRGEDSALTDALVTACAAGAAVLVFLLARLEARTLSARARRWAFAFGLATVVPVAGVAYAMATDPAARAVIAAANGSPSGFPLFIGLVAGLLFLLAVQGWTLGQPSAQTSGKLRADSLFALSFGLYAVFQPASTAGLVALLWEELPTMRLPFIANILLSFVAIHAFALPAPQPAKRARQNSYLVLLAASLAALAYGVALLPPFAIPEFGAYGIIRTIGACLLALAVLRNDLLGVPLPRLVVQRGTLTTAGLASFFIVTQIAQNFLSDEYGLLTGGIVAGAVLFAASPLQRALERRSERRGRTGPQPADVEAFRHVAARLAADGRLSASDHRALAVLADQLGLGALAVAEALAAHPPKNPEPAQG